MALTHVRLVQVMSVLQSMSVLQPDTARADFLQNASLHVSSSAQSLLLLQSPVKQKKNGVSSTEIACVILKLKLQYHIWSTDFQYILHGIDKRWCDLLLGTMHSFRMALDKLY